MGNNYAIIQTMKKAIEREQLRMVLSRESIALLDKITVRDDTTRGGVITRLIRDRARALGIPVPGDPVNEETIPGY